MFKLGIFLFIILFFANSFCFSQSWKRADSLCLKFLTVNKYDSALYFAEEACAIIRGTDGEKNIHFADMLNGMVVSHFYLGNYSKAKYYNLKEITLRESLKATNDEGYINSLKNAAIICKKSGSYEESLNLIKKAEKKALTFYGLDNPEYANILSTFGSVYNDLGCSNNDVIFLKQAEEYFTKADNIFKKYGKKFIYFDVLNKSNLASYQNNVGNSPLAESIFQKQILLCEQGYGTNNTIYASSLNNIGVFYYNKGNYMQSEKYFNKAVEIYRKSSEAESKYAAICINNLGALYHDIGNYKLADKYITEALNLFEKNEQKSHINYAFMLNNLALIKMTKNYYSSSGNKRQEALINSGNLFMQADSIFDVNCTMPNPEGYIIKTNIALWYKLTGNSSKALNIVYDQITLTNRSAFNSVSLIKKMPLIDHLKTNQQYDNQAKLEPILITITTKITDHLQNEKALEKNEENQIASTKFLIRLIIGKRNKIKKELGPYHPGYASLIKMLTPLYKSIGDYDMEETLTLEYINVFIHNTLQDFSFLSESEKEFYFQTSMSDIYSFIAYTLRRKDKNPAITAEAYNFVLLNKGLMLKSNTAMRLAILNSKDTSLLKKYDEWISLQKEISALYSVSVDLRKKDIATLETEANVLEKDLVQNSQSFGDYRKGLQLTWLNVRDSLKNDEAAIEFTHFKVKQKDGIEKTFYCALIIKSDSKYPEMIQLFEEIELENIIEKSNANNINYINKVYGTKNIPDNRLYKLIWQPIEPYLNNVKNVYLSPSGLLYKISFATLSSEKNIYLSEKYQLQIKGSTGISVNSNILSAQNNISALIFGGIQYNSESSDTKIWNYLDGTKSEADAIRNILEKQQVNVKYLSDFNATETSLKQYAKNYNFIHVATHGFSFPDPNDIKIIEKSQKTEVGEVAFRGSMSGIGMNSFVNNQNPLMRSGLVFAGANDVWNNDEISKPDDGVLTALEVSQIDLRKTDLVVLSACETGLGDIIGSEGVYGLQRAFKMAGSKFIIMSLWQVPDKETSEFMTTFYEKLLILKDIRKSFNETQSEMRNKFDPYYWAAFVLVE